MEQQNISTVNQNHHNDQNEINLGQLFKKIWLRKTAIFGFVFIFVLIVLGWLSVKYLVEPPIKEYSRVMTLNFPGAANGQYPSGQKFAASDMLTTKVLSDVYKKNNLGAQNISEGQFLEAFSVSPYATNLDFINKKFNALLDDKKLSRPEIEGLEKEYLLQLNTARNNFIKIAYTNSSLLPLAPFMISKVLIDIPKTWSKNAIGELGVLNLKTHSGSSYELNIGERFEYVKMISYLQKGSKDLDNALQVLLTDEIGGSIHNSKSNKSVLDVKAQLENLVEFELNPLFSIITSLGIAKSKFKAKLYLQNSIIDLADKKLLLQEKQKNYQIILNTYVQTSSRTKSIEENRSQTRDTGFTQIDAGVFASITSLIEDNSDATYKQKLLNEQLLLMQEVEDVSSSLLKLERALLQIDKKKEAVLNEAEQEYIDRIEFTNKQLVSLIDEYRVLLSLRNEQVLGSSTALYELTDGEMTITSRLKSFIKHALLIGILATILALMMAVLVALIMKKPEQAE